MGSIPFPGDGAAAHLAWLADRLGSSGSWLVETARTRPGAPARRSHGLEVTHELIATLGQLTEDLPTEWCPSGALEVSGPRVGEWSDAVEGYQEFVDLDGGELSLANPDDPLGQDSQRIGFERLPASMVSPIQRLTSGPAADYEPTRELIRACVGEWRRARSGEVGLARDHEAGLHLRWSRAGHTILTALAERYEARQAADPATMSLRADVYDPVIALGHQVIDEQALPNPPFGPLRREPAAGS